MHLLFFIFIFYYYYYSGVCLKIRNVRVEKESLFIKVTNIVSGKSKEHFVLSNLKRKKNIKEKIFFNRGGPHVDTISFIRKEKGQDDKVKSCQDIEEGTEVAAVVEQLSQLSKMKRKKKRKSEIQDMCSIINREHEEVTRELTQLKINNDISISNVLKEKKNKITDFVEAYWIPILQTKYFYYFLKKGKPLIFSVSSGVDSLTTLYSFLFLLYKLIIFSIYKNANYSDLTNKMKEVYSYTYEDIYRFLFQMDGYEKNFFFNVLKNVTVIYFNHQTRPECREEQKLVKSICKEHHLNFKCKVLTEKVWERLKRKKGNTKDNNSNESNDLKNEINNNNNNNNNFLSLVRMWWRNCYIEVIKLQAKIKRKEKSDEKSDEESENTNNLKEESLIINTVAQRDLKTKYTKRKNVNVKYSFKKYMSDIKKFVSLTMSKNICISIMKRHPYYSKRNSMDQVHILKKSTDKNAKCIRKGIIGLVFLGHTQNDTNETILFKLFRGVSVKNLTGIKFCTVFKSCFLLRPLIKLNKIVLYRYMLTINKKWMFDKSNAKLGYSRNIIRNVIIPNISFLLRGKKESEKIRGKEHKEQTTLLLQKDPGVRTHVFPIIDIENKTEKDELQSCQKYADTKINRRISTLNKECINLQNHVNYYFTLFDLYIKRKYYYNEVADVSDDIFVNEFINMQNKLYEKVFTKKGINHLIQIHKILYKQNIFLKIFNMNEFLLLPSKFLQLEVLHQFFKTYGNVNLAYAKMEKVYDEMLNFVTNQKRQKAGEIEKEDNMQNDSKMEKSRNNTVKLVDLNGKCHLILNKTFFRIVPNKAENKKIIEKNATIFIHDDLSIFVKRISIRNIQKEKWKLYLLIKKRKKKKKEKFDIHIRYLKKNDYIFYNNKKIKASRFLSNHNIPYIYKYALPVVHITNFPPHKNILFVSLFQEKTKNKNFFLKDRIRPEHLARYFLYGIHFLNFPLL